MNVMRQTPSGAQDLSPRSDACGIYRPPIHHDQCGDHAPTENFLDGGRVGVHVR